MLEDLFLYRIATRTDYAATSAESAETRSRSTADTVEQLTKRVGALELAVETLLRLLVESGRMEEKEFLQKVQSIDAEDGYIDGRRDTSKLRKLCPSCGKASAADRPRCMWCETDLGGVKAERIGPLA
jgi:hypothetical protein